MNWRRGVPCPVPGRGFATEAGVKSDGIDRVPLPGARGPDDCGVREIADFAVFLFHESAGRHPGYFRPGQGLGTGNSMDSGGNKER